MSAPERHPTAPDTTGGQLVHQPTVTLTRTERTVRWAGHHLGELLAVALPTVAAIWSWWWLLGTVAAAALWVVHEQRVRHRKGGDAQ